MFNYDDSVALPYSNFINVHFPTLRNRFVVLGMTQKYTVYYNIILFSLKACYLYILTHAV